MSEKKVLFFIPGLLGGGAERVMISLANEFYRNGIDVSIVLSSAARGSEVKHNLNKKIPLVFLTEYEEKNASKKAARIFSSLECKIYESLKKSVPAGAAYRSFVAEYGEKITAFRKLLIDNPEASVISFLQPTNPISLIAAQGLPNKIIISERGDASRLMRHRYGRNFIEKYYTRLNGIVFQTENAKNVYPENIAVKGCVISNPLKEDLPEPYCGERNNNITTFCRISPEKRLDILIRAFALLDKENNGFRLRIIGDATNKSQEQLKLTYIALCDELGIADKVDFIPHSADVHNMILCDRMFINCSEHEGMSNSMLEALAIGMPTICTDCPIGGARATITDGENGLLVPINDEKALYKAMKKLIDDTALSEKISRNSVRIREEQSLETIAEKWMRLV